MQVERHQPKTPADAIRPVELCIVGGGAAGLFAAAAAARLRVPVLLIERKARVGSKMMMTANGRCNFTRDLPPAQFLADLGELPSCRAAASFAARALQNCPPARIVQFFRTARVPLRRTPDLRFFPADGKAASIVHAFGDLMRDSGLPLLTNTAVTGVKPRPNGGFTVETAGFSFAARNVLLATGGMSYPKLGCTGDGYAFARALGHDIAELRAGLIGLETDDPRVLAQAGRRFEDGTVRVIDGVGRTLAEFRGEVDCERFGLSGGAIYNAERFLAHYARSYPDRPAPSATAAFAGLRIRLDRPRPRPLKEAIVTVGGVALDGVDPATMQSRRQPGLYFAGELLDLDGPTGGYNLTLAFATAATAVEAIAAGRARNAPNSRAKKADRRPPPTAFRGPKDARRA